MKSSKCNICGVLVMNESFELHEISIYLPVRL